MFETRNPRGLRVNDWLINNKTHGTNAIVVCYNEFLMLLFLANDRHSVAKMFT